MARARRWAQVVTRVASGSGLDAVEALHGAREALGAGGDAGGQRLGEILEPDMVVLRNDQRVPRLDRVEVQEGEDMVILEDLLRRQVAARDAAEKTVNAHASGLSACNPSSHSATSGPSPSTIAATPSALGCSRSSCISSE